LKEIYILYKCDERREERPTVQADFFNVKGKWMGKSGNAFKIHRKERWRGGELKKVKKS
jgi:hypothetical protein